MEKTLNKSYILKLLQKKKKLKFLYAVVTIINNYTRVNIYLQGNQELE